MQQISCFRGMAGEVVREFLHPRSLWVAVPLIAVFLLFGRVSIQLDVYGRWFLGLLFLFLYMMQTGRHAVAASQGRIEATNDLGDVFFFSVRYFFFTLAWLLPVLLLCRLLAGKSLESLLFSLHPLQVSRMGYPGLGQLALALLCFLLALAGLLIATRSASLAAFWSRETWLWLAVSRRDDVAALSAGLLGGLAVFSLLYALPICFVTVTAGKILPRHAADLGLIGNLVPVAVLPRLLGHLGGALVASERVASVEQKGGEFTPTIVAASLEPELVLPQDLVITKVPPEPKPDVAEIAGSVERLQDGEVRPAILRAEEALAAGDRPLRQTIALALLCRKVGDATKSATYAGDAIEGLLKRRLDSLALNMLFLFRAERAALRISSPALERLGDLLLGQRSYLDAAWCHHSGLLAAGEGLKAQKKLLQIAQEAEKAGREKDALHLYRLFVNNYPDSGLIDFARRELDRLSGRQ